MKIKINLILVLLVVMGMTGCGPSPKNEGAENRPLLLDAQGMATSDSAVVTALFPTKKYQESLGLLTIFWWPSDEEIKMIREKSAQDLINLPLEMKALSALIVEQKQRIAELEKTEKSEEAYAVRQEMMANENKLYNFTVRKDVAPEIAKLTNFNDVAAMIGLHSSLMDKIYDKSDPMIRAEKRLESEFLDTQKKFKAKKEAELAAILKPYYACVTKVNAAGKTVCDRKAVAGDDESTVKSPARCDLLTSIPFSTLFKNKVGECGGMAKEFTKKKLDELFAAENKELLANYEQAKKLNAEFKVNEKINSEIALIMMSVDPYHDVLEKRMNWVETNYGSSKIIFVKNHVEMVLALKINNSIDSSVGVKELQYFSHPPKEGEVADITDLLFFVENKTPAIKFRLYEKRAVSGNKAERTGYYFEGILRQNAMSFGLIYSGKIKRYNAEGVMVNHGMMKAIIREATE
ncbi:MAG: hypothetical protein HQK52_12200 [Oligoflexia bacterium]|nr:hypothetical protein [Oligoflexia bacterium]